MQKPTYCIMYVLTYINNKCQWNPLKVVIYTNFSLYFCAIFTRKLDNDLLTTVLLLPIYHKLRMLFIDRKYQNRTPPPYYYVELDTSQGIKIRLDNRVGGSTIVQWYISYFPSDAPSLKNIHKQVGLYKYYPLATYTFREMYLCRENVSTFVGFRFQYYMILEIFCHTYS